MLRGLKNLLKKVSPIGKEVYERSTLHKMPLKDNVLLIILIDLTRDITLDLVMNLSFQKVKE